MRTEFCLISLAVVGILAGLSHFHSMAWLHVFWVVGPLILLGTRDMLQTRHAVKRNFPIIGHFRYILEAIRPEINQYFIESNWDGMPFSREFRSVVYQRAKHVRDTVPFGTQRRTYENGYEWINHSLEPTIVNSDLARVSVGGKDCSQPYSASIFNISAMSYGALSKNAIQSLNGGAKKGGFAHNTGEGSVSPYHLKEGGDLIWQIGTGYFGCRSAEGGFDPDKFAKTASRPEVKMIEIKLSQGAKPGHGGILPAAKISPEIANIRGVPMGKDVNSPPFHSAFNGPRGLLRFIKQLRELSGGKPVGFKLCVGKRREFLAVVKGMLETGIQPDFITVDGAEGGTGAAPVEFANSIGTPLNHGLPFVNNALVGANLRDEIRIFASGKVVTGFHLAARLAQGADACYSARGMMFALGCIQALRCNANVCPVGVATTDPELVKGLHVPSKIDRIYHYHKATIHSFCEVVGAAGIEKPSDLRPWHIHRQVSDAVVKHYGEIYETIKPGALLGADLPKSFERAWNQARPDSYEPQARF